ncbi:MAG: acetyl-CoA hydrolase/transferase C-terminal domain-containing protein [Dehalococcoidales bacterium]|jgi:acyl-CoA hydrolase|nr:hypothetical protein [Syntrophales bacterium]MDX9803399.1 acetyl-CoA hydrolase/transferase C-terminal domain-containing protein [Dehalococcoidales bacterium]
MWQYKVEPTLWRESYKPRSININKWEEAYRQKTITAEEAVSFVENDSTIRLSGGCLWPNGYVRALMRRKKELQNIRIDHMLTLEMSDPELNYAAKDCKGHFFVGSWFTTDKVLRDAVNEGRAAHVPHNFGENNLIQIRYQKDDFFVTEVSAPDKHGFCSISTCVSHVPENLTTSKKIIFEVNDQQPYGRGPEAMVHISQADYIIENSHPLPVFPFQQPTDIEKAIGHFIADLIEDESIIQLGIGGLPNAVALFLKDKKHLGMHSEMMGDAALYLVKSGALDGSPNLSRPGKLIYDFAMGSQELYDFTDENHFLEAWPVSYTNDPHIISNNPKQIAINAALQVDFTGQVSSESIGHRHYSGTGGQMLFTLGAFYSPGGKAFITLPSTQQVDNEPVSTIVHELLPGAIVTTPRSIVNYVVTEYGVAQLRGKSCVERARELIAIAHPNFRDQLRFEAKKLKLL